MEIKINNEGKLEKETVAGFLEATESLNSDKIHKNTIMFVLSLHKSLWSRDLYKFLSEYGLDFIPKIELITKIKELGNKYGFN